MIDWVYSHGVSRIESFRLFRAPNLLVPGPAVILHEVDTAGVSPGSRARARGGFILNSVVFSEIAFTSVKCVAVPPCSFPIFHRTPWFS